MTTLKAIELENGKTIYMQVDENILLPPDQTKSTSGTRTRSFDDASVLQPPSNKAVEKLNDVISAMTDTAANSFKESTFGNVDKVTLEFGIKLAGEAGIPFITSGKAEGSVTIKVEFSPKDTDDSVTHKND